ncbi:uncharacterized protein DUF4235 [Mumia flava]|uniref:Uncharacterized protein DUF4235 n=1 Tax=Mumia flava TaxID=1348852 RepID=A0A0B2BU32_9ACTN|nr:DUF4235 domain-containing protein [Mumia flava]PJJ57071.1 uncharacterized protein DUF4235 [Mumia flava]
MPSAAKLAYRPVGIVSGIAGGMAAAAIFKKVWAKVDDSDEKPDPLSSAYGWREILLAAAIQGLIYGVVKASIDRAGAQGFHRFTGEWPGD